MIMGHEFRVVVVGAGPVGLVAGHALRAAGINNFVILEQQKQIVRPVGAALSLHPQTSRILDQLGLYEDVLEVSVPYDGKINVDHRGHVISSSLGLFEVWEQKYVCMSSLLWLVFR